MYPICFFVIALVLALVHIVILDTAIVQTVLLYLLVVTVGFMGLFAFVGHFFKADVVAGKIGWPVGNPFQQEIAFANLAFGVMGILCIWLRGDFWLATLIGKTVFLWGAAFVHIKDIRHRQNKNIYNAGPVLYADILLPVIWLLFALIYFW